MTKNQRSIDTKKLVGISMFCALAYGATFVFRIPVMFLTFDAKDTIITIAALTDPCQALQYLSSLHFLSLLR